MRTVYRVDGTNTILLDAEKDVIRIDIISGHRHLSAEVDQEEFLGALSLLIERSLMRLELCKASAKYTGVCVVTEHVPHRALIVKVLLAIQKVLASSPEIVVGDDGNILWSKLDKECTNIAALLLAVAARVLSNKEAAASLHDDVKRLAEKAGVTKHA